VREFLAARIAEGSMPGASWWVEGREGVLSRGTAGWAALEPAREPLRDDTPFDLASLTKPLATALVAVLLEGDGTLDPDAPAGAHLPELRGTPYAAATLTDLASHRSGLPAWRPLYLSSSGLDGFVREIAALAPAAAPGTTLYSDLSYLLLGAVLERATGKALDALFDARVACPLDLRLTGFARRPGRFADAAATEDGNRFERELAGEPGTGFGWRAAIPRGEVHDGNAHALGGVAGHAGLFGSAAEVAAIARELLFPRRLPLTVRGRGRLLSPVAGPSTRTFGFTTAALSSGARGALPDLAPGHTGFTGTSLWLDPPAGRVYVLLTHRIHPVVSAQDFQPVRREFHRLAAALA
jgi:CubicO group peptidase (beta-lactamase class C family)